VRTMRFTINLPQVRS